MNESVKPAEMLRKMLIEGHGEVSAAAEECFVDDTGPVYMQFAGRAASAYKQYQRRIGADIEPALEAVEKDMDELPERLNQMFNEGHDEIVGIYKKEYRATLRPSQDEKITNEATRVGEGTGPDKTTEPSGPALVAGTVEYDLKKAAVAIAGDPDIRIPIIKTSRLDVLWTMIFFCVVILLDYLTSYSMLAEGSDASTALGLTGITIIGFLLLTRFTSIGLKRYSAHRDALRAFRNGAAAGLPKTFTVAHFPVGTCIVAFGGLIVSVVFSIVLLASRMWLADVGQSGFSGIAASVGLLFAFLVYGLIEFHTARPYTPEQYAALENLYVREEAERTGKSPQWLSEPTAENGDTAVNSDETEPSYSPYPKIAYHQRYLELEANVTACFDEAVDRKKLLVELLLEYQDMWDLTTLTYFTMCNMLNKLVAEQFNVHGSKLTCMGHPGGTKEFNAAAEEILIQAVGDRVYDNDERLKVIERFDFSFALPDRRCRDFSEWDAEVRRSIALVTIGSTEPKKPRARVEPKNQETI